MTRTIISGMVSAACLGYGMAGLFASIYGTGALPFTVFAALGFAIGAGGFYRDSLRKSLLALDRYPLLLRLHLNANFPNERFDTYTVERLRMAFQGRGFGAWTRHGMLLASWMTATPALDVSYFKVLRSGAVFCI
jgi:hypothetical protein